MMMMMILAFGCTDRETARPAPAPSATAAGEAVPQADALRASASDAEAEPPVAASVSETQRSPDARVARGSVRLVVQSVYADCGGSWGGGGVQKRLFGQDLLLRIQSPETAAKPGKEYVFCPSHGEDGGLQKPRLQALQNCRAFASCRVVAAEGGAAPRAELQCDKENVVLESVGERTFLRGSFGTREIAPYPMQIAPVVRELRNAAVDC
jgi:hypothetical protein